MNDEILEEMRDTLNEFKSDTESRLALIEYKVGRLEQLVYGGVGVILVAVITAIMAIVIKQ